MDSAEPVCVCVCVDVTGIFMTSSNGFPYHCPITIPPYREYLIRAFGKPSVLSSKLLSHKHPFTTHSSLVISLQESAFIATNFLSQTSHHST